LHGAGSSRDNSAVSISSRAGAVSAGRRDRDGVGAKEDSNGHCDGAGGVDGAGEADGDAVGDSDRAGVGDGDLDSRRDAAATEGHGDGDEDETASQEWDKPDPKGTPQPELSKQAASSRCLDPALGLGVCKACLAGHGVEVRGEWHCVFQPIAAEPTIPS
jgi:hypothetical protein